MALLLTVAVDTACTTGCEEGAQLECACSAPCSYHGCGNCGPGIEQHGTRVCSEDGVWGTCSCYPDPEPDCEETSCPQDCSPVLREVVAQLATGASEADCRAAVVQAFDCMGCEWDVEGCAAELEALDLACLGQTHMCSTGEPTG